MEGEILPKKGKAAAPHDPYLPCRYQKERAPLGVFKTFYQRDHSLFPFYAYTRSTLRRRSSLPLERRGT